MKKILIISLVVICLLSATMFSGRRVSLQTAINKGRGRFLLRNETVKIPKLPASVQEFKSLRSSIAKNPKGGYAMFIVAMMAYVKNPELGMKFFTLTLDRRKVTRSCRRVPTIRGYCPNRSSLYHIKRLRTRKYIPGIYIMGTKVSNGYKYSFPATITFNQATIRSKNMIKMFANTTSGNRARPITLKRNNRGLWKAYEFSSMMIGASRIPRGPQQDDDL